MEELHVLGQRYRLETDLKWYGTVRDRITQWPRDVLNSGNPGNAEQAFGDLVQHDHVGGVSEIATGLHQQDVRVYPRGAEMPFGCRIADVGCHVRRNVPTVVVAR